MEKTILLEVYTSYNMFGKDIEPRWVRFTVPVDWYYEYLENEGLDEDCVGGSDLECLYRDAVQDGVAWRQEVD